MKQCSGCNNIKELTEFNKNAARSDGLQSFCRICTRKKSRDFYQSDKKRFYKDVKRRQKLKHEEHKKFIMEYLSTHPCIDCGEDDIVVLEFDHRSDKRHNICEMIRSGPSKEKVQKEIDKCDVRCANCHRRKTAKDFGFYRYKNSNAPIV